MSTLLRKVKSTINGRNDHANNNSTLPRSTRDGRANNTSAPDLSTRYPTQRSRKSNERIITATRRPPLPERPRRRAQPLKQQPEQQATESPHPLTELRRRLVHKASTFSLRAKRWRHERDQPSNSTEVAKEEERVKENTFLAGEDARVVEQTYQRLQSIATATVKAAIAQEELAKTGQGLGERDLQFRDAIHQAIHQHQRTSTNTSSISTLCPAIATACTQIENNEEDPDKDETGQGITPHQSQLQGVPQNSKSKGGYKASIRIMAAEHATPPVPYTRLKEITETACETALSGVTSYSHSDTESWNTTIINNILGALVAETTQQSAASGSAPGQPQFKYVVNSTIIQHASSSSTAASTPSEESTKKVGGRRGMHAASGAYWNNEKDGMWSFKYPGADSKGLDVVVGVIWIWVG